MVLRLALAGTLLMSATASAKLGPHFTVSSTAYDPCSSGSLMADGHRVHTGAVANNFLPLETLIRFDRRVAIHDGQGRLLHKRFFRVQDRIGWGSQLDVWHANCAEANAWGRRTIGFRVVLKGH